MFDFIKKKTVDKNDPKSAAKLIRDVKSCQDSIPFKDISKNGIIGDYTSRYSKTYKLSDVNFETEEDDSQEKMFLNWEKVINIIDHTSVGQLTVINKNIDMDVIRNEVLLKPNNLVVPEDKKDLVNSLRDDINNKFINDLSQGKNNIKKESYLTVSIPANDIVDANTSFTRLDTQVSKAFRKISKEPLPALNAKERLAIMYDAYYNVGEPLTFTKKMEKLTVNGNLDFKKMAQNNIGFLDAIAPNGMTFSKDIMKIGDNYARTYFIDSLPTELPVTFLNELTDVPCNMIASISWTQMDVATANNLIKQRMMDMNAAIGKQEADAMREGISNEGAVSSELINMRDEAKELMDDIRKRNMKSFLVTPLVTLIAPTKEELIGYEKMIKIMFTKFSCQLRLLENQQENAFNTSLPLGQLNVADDRFLQSEATAVFFPFAVKDLNQEGGVDYGTNPLSHNMVRINRWHANSANGLFVGISGSGKSLQAKNQLLQQYFNSDDQILIIDPEGEYVPIAEELGGEIIRITYSNTSYINPMDMDINSGDGGNPIPKKCDELITLINTMMGTDDISATMKSTITRAVNMTYREYYNHMLKLQTSGSKITCDRDAMPTLANLFSELIKMNEPEAQYIAQAIESHCVGDGAIFSHRTNINPHNKLIVFDVSEMSDNMKDVAMQVAMSYCWNRIIENGSHAKRTNLYIDEFHLFTKNRISANYMANIYKRARKYHGAPTAITQNIKDMFVNDAAETIFANCTFICMTSQSPTDRPYLEKMLSLSSKQMDYITDQPPGCGLIYTGTTVVPFENDIDQSTEFFRLLDSRKKEKKHEDNSISSMMEL